MTTTKDAVAAPVSYRDPPIGWAARLRGGPTTRVATGLAQEAEFVEFARAAAPRLRKTAFLMCRDWHLAHDLTQITLAKMFASWKRISGSANLGAYSRTVLMRALFDHRRRRSGQEIAIAAVPEPAARHHAGPDLRMTLIDALGYLSDRDRAIVVLRYWEDQSVDTVAQVLGVSVAVVKAQSARSLTKLRELLNDSRAELLFED
jgi:RNA polymerase sigma-70 factor (sigma-E family)